MFLRERKKVQIVPREQSAEISVQRSGSPHGPAARHEGRNSARRVGNFWQQRRVGWITRSIVINRRAAIPELRGRSTMATKKPNILVLCGDDIGTRNVSYFSSGMMGYRTPNIDRVANEGVAFTDSYGQQSCTAGRAAFITGQNPLRTGLTKVGMPGAPVGLQAEDPTIADLLKPLGYATGQFGKNHLGDRNEYLPTVHGFDEFFGNLYHLNAEEEPELPDYPKDPKFLAAFGPRGVLHCVATDKDDATVEPRWGRVGKQTVKDTGPLTKKRMETIDEEITAGAIGFMEKQVKANKPFFLWYNSTAMHFRTHLADKRSEEHTSELQ